MDGWWRPALIGTCHVDWISFSVGWKEYELGEQPERMLQVADEALYQHKQSRKNAQLVSIPG